MRHASSVRSTARSTIAVTPHHGIMGSIIMDHEGTDMRDMRLPQKCDCEEERDDDEDDGRGKEQEEEELLTEERESESWNRSRPAGGEVVKQQAATLQKNLIVKQNITFCSCDIF